MRIKSIYPGEYRSLARFVYNLALAEGKSHSLSLLRAKIRVAETHERWEADELTSLQKIYRTY